MKVNGDRFTWLGIILVMILFSIFQLNLISFLRLSVIQGQALYGFLYTGFSLFIVFVGLFTIIAAAQHKMVSWVNEKSFITFISITILTLLGGYSTAQFVSTGKINRVIPLLNKLQNILLIAGIGLLLIGIGLFYMAQKNKGK